MIHILFCSIENMHDFCFKWINSYNNPRKLKAIQKEMGKTDIGKEVNTLLENTLKRKDEIYEEETSFKQWDAGNIQKMVSQLEEVSGLRSNLHGLSANRMKQIFVKKEVKEDKNDLIFLVFDWFNTHNNPSVQSQAGTFLLHALASTKNYRLQSLVYPLMMRYIEKSQLEEGLDLAKQLEKIENPNSLLGIALLYKMVGQPVKAYSLIGKMLQLDQDLPAYHRAMAAEMAARYCLHMSTNQDDKLLPRQRRLQALKKLQEAIDLGEKALLKELADLYKTLGKQAESEQALAQFGELSKEELHIKPPKFCCGLPECSCKSENEPVLVQSITIGDQHLTEPVHPENDLVDRKIRTLLDEQAYTMALHVLETMPVKNSWTYIYWKLCFLEEIIFEGVDFENEEYVQAWNTYVHLTEDLFSRGFVSLALDIAKAYQLKALWTAKMASENEHLPELRNGLDKLMEISFGYFHFALDSGDARANSIAEEFKRQMREQKQSVKIEYHPLKTAPAHVQPGETVSRKLEEKERDEAIQKEIDTQRQKEAHFQKALKETSAKFIPTINYRPFSSETPITFSQPTSVSADVYDRLSDVYAHKPMTWQDLGRLIQDLGGRCGRQHNGTWQYTLPHREDRERWIKRTMHNPIHNTGEEINFNCRMQRDSSINLLLSAGYMLEALARKV